MSALQNVSVLQNAKDEQYYYVISGLMVQSALPLHGSVDCNSPQGPPDLTIRLAKVPEVLDGAISSGPTWYFAPPSFLLEVPGVVRFVVTAGTEILVEPASGASLDDAAIFVVGSAIAVALYQRGALAFHASAVSDGNRAFAFSGDSGAGKSTLAALLCVDGDCEMLSDDVSALSLKEGEFCLDPDGRRFRLWEDVIDLMDLGDRRGRQVRSMVHKYHVELQQHHQGASPRLRAIYVLHTLPEGSDPTIEALPLGRAAFALDHHRYRRLISKEIGEPARQFQQMVQLLEHVPVFLFGRSITAADNPRSISCLKKHWASLA